ncbi:MAG: restriction endonuclease subunit S [Saccharofermentanales bacterium]
MMPNGWQVRTMGDVLEKVAIPVQVDPKKMYQEIGIRSHGKGIFHKEPILGSALGDKRVFWVQPNAFVVNIVFAWEQAVACTTNREQGMIASHRFPMFRPKEGLCDVDFLAYFFKTRRGKALLELASPGGAGRNKTLGQKEFLDIPILLPPQKEQIKIARILATWDKAIAISEMLIETSEAQKKVLVQKLLTGKLLRKGFVGNWRNVRLADVAEIIVSNVDKKTVCEEKPVMLCNYTDVYHNQYITQTMCFMEATASESEIKKFSLKKGDILITKDSERADDIAVAACVRDSIEGLLCGYHLAIVRPKKNKVDGVFLNSLFSIDSVRHHFASRANGVTRFGLSVNVIKDAVFSIPSFEEQCKVSKMILAADDEIAAQRKRLNALKLEKQALMQMLLTGKRRVKMDDIPADKTAA